MAAESGASAASALWDAIAKWSETDTPGEEVRLVPIRMPGCDPGLCAPHSICDIARVLPGVRSGSSYTRTALAKRLVAETQTCNVETSD